MEQLGLFFAVDRNMQQCNYFGKDLGIKIPRSFICYSPKLEATQKSMERWMDKQIEVHLYDGILPNSKMDELLIQAMMWECQNNHAKWKKPDEGYILFDSKYIKVKKI